MDHIAQIHLTKFVFLSFLDFQTILQKMCKGTGCKPFQFRRTVVQFFPVECHCRRFSDAALRCSLVCRPNPAKTLLPPFFRPQIPGKQFFPAIVLLLFPSFRSPPRRISVACCAICIWLISSFGLSWITSFGYIRRIIAIRYAGLCACPARWTGRRKDTDTWKVSSDSDTDKSAGYTWIPSPLAPVLPDGCREIPGQTRTANRLFPVFRDNSIVDPRKNSTLMSFSRVRSISPSNT